MPCAVFFNNAMRKNELIIFVVPAIHGTNLCSVLLMPCVTLFLYHEWHCSNALHGSIFSALRIYLIFLRSTAQRANMVVKCSNYQSEKCNNFRI